MNGAEMFGMAGRRVARIGDKVACPFHGPNVIATGSLTSEIDGRGVARVGDLCVCGCTIIEGDARATLEGRPVAYLGSKLSSGGMVIECQGSASFS